MIDIDKLGFVFTQGASVCEYRGTILFINIKTMNEFIHKLFKSWSIMYFIASLMILFITRDIQMSTVNFLITVCITLISILYGKENRE